MEKYIIFKVNEIFLIDFSLILQTSEETLRTSLDGTKTIIGWITDDPPLFIDSLTTKEGPYYYEEIIEILSGPEWVSNEL